MFFKKFLNKFIYYLNTILIIPLFFRLIFFEKHHISLSELDEIQLEMEQVSYIYI